MGERRESRKSEAAPQLVSAEAAGAADGIGTSPVGAETAGRSAKIVYPRQLHAFEREPKMAGVSAISAETARSPAETQFDRVVDSPASARPAAVPGRNIRERLRRPLMLALPIVLAVFGAAYYLSEEPYVSTDDAFVRAAKVTVNARVSGQAGRDCRP